MTEPTVGRAILRVDDRVAEAAPVPFEKPLAGRVFYGWVEVKEQLERWKSFLLLPEGYRVIGAFFDIHFQTWELVVEGADIPLPPQNALLPHLVPVYERIHNEATGEYQTHLLRVEVQP